jgi:pyruvate dehydrogenase E2 component (dihydrolipoamide acetyltransferase)
MAFSVQMPALGESVTEGTVTRWLKQEGDRVEVDEPLLEVSTDKVDTEIPSPAAGVLSRIVVNEEQTVQVGAELAVIDETGDGHAGGGGSQAQHTPWREPFTQPVTEEAGAPTDTPADAPSTEQHEPAARPTAGTSDSGGDGTPVTMPALGESVTEGTVTRWLKKVGDTVDVDEPLLEVSTDKVDTEIPSPVAGTVLEINVDQEETVQVGATLAVIGSGQARPSEPSEPAEPSGASERQERPAPPHMEEQEPALSEDAEPPPALRTEQTAPAREQAPTHEPTPTQHALFHAAPGTDGQTTAPYVTPLVRKLAAEHDVDLSSIKGTGVGGRIRKQDVLAAADAKAAAQAEPEPEPQPEPAVAAPAATAGAPTLAGPPSTLRGRTEKMSRLRQVIAKRMVESLQTSAQLTTVLEVDVTRIARLRDRTKRDFEAREGVKLSFLPFFAKATVEALKQHPKLNASINSETNEVTYHGAEHLGMAVDTERGLLVPVIHDAGDLNIAGLARRIADLAERTRNNKITPDELSGGTFTLTNTGSRGVLFDTPIINQPQVAILGTGGVIKRPVAVSDENGDTIAIRSMMYLALSYDHRLVDGADAARFLTAIRERLEEGNFDADL